MDLPVEYSVNDRITSPSMTVMEARKASHLWFIFTGPQGGEMVVPFDTVAQPGGDGEQLVLERDGVEVFTAEHWGQWGDVSAWFEAQGAEA